LLLTRATEVGFRDSDRNTVSLPSFTQSSLGSVKKRPVDTDRFYIDVSMATIPPMQLWGIVFQAVV
jgi:hypothetical protein